MKTAFLKIIAPITLAVFVLIIFGGVFSMSFGSDGQMIGDCPFSTTGEMSLCPGNAIAAVLHHTGLYSAFFSVFASGRNLALFLLFTLVLIAALFALPPSLSSPPAENFVFKSLPKQVAGRKILRWLSFFENSPSLS